MVTHWFASFLTKNASTYMIIAKTPITELAFNITNRFIVSGRFFPKQLLIDRDPLKKETTITGIMHQR